MKSGNRKRLLAVATVGTILFLAVGASACCNSGDETVALLEDAKFGLAHLNDEFHTIKEILADCRTSATKGHI